MMAVATTSAVSASAGTEPAGDDRRRARRWGPRRTVGLAIATIAAVIGIWLGLSGSGHHSSVPPAASGSPTAHLPAAGLPTLGAASAVEINNPALNDIGDPYILPVPAGVDGMQGPGYVLYWTTDWAANVPTAVSTDLINWRRVADALPILPAWALVVRPPQFWSAPAGVSTDTWGPTVHQVAGGWVLYYSTADTSTQRECLGSAFSTSPVGPFTDTSSAPLVCQAALGGDIDPSVVVPAPGQLALLWKNDGNANGTAVSIWEQPLTPDGRAVTGRPVRLIGSDQAWQHNIIEGPSMLADTKGGWWLFYSGGTWQSDTYDTGVAWCATVAGPCKEPGSGPLLASTSTAVSPGGFDTFVDHQGRLWASYSAFPTHPADARAAMASPRVLELALVRSH
jgi:beta-xylosidase